MASVNKVIILGNLGRNPEVRYSAEGSVICNLSIATSFNWRDRNTGERREQTEWHRVVLFGRLAEIASEYLAKGHSVYIEGRLQTRKWIDQNGVERYMTEIVAEQMQMLGSRGDSQAHQQQAHQPQQPQQPQQMQAQQTMQHQSAQSQRQQQDWMEDDIPF